MADRRSGAARTVGVAPTAGRAGPLVEFDIEEHIFYLFGQVYGRRNRQLADIFHEFGLTNPKYRVLAGLTNRDGCSIGALAELTAVERTTLSRALDQLVDEKLVRRVPRKGDKRTIEVWLTPAGWRKLERVWPLIVTENDRAVAGLTDSEIETLKALLRKMIGNLKDDDGRAKSL